MESLREYAEKYGVKEIENDYGEHRCTREGRIIFPNGKIASIVEDEKTGKYSVAVCDYNGFFDWEILNEFGATNGRICCDTEQEVIDACEIIRGM